MRDEDGGGYFYLINPDIIQFKIILQNHNTVIIENPAKLKNKKSLSPPSKIPNNKAIEEGMVIPIDITTNILRKPSLKSIRSIYHFLF